MTEDMPQRPYQHVLESDSRKAFEQRLPGNWIVEPREHDYGIDLDVEIFDGDSATGMRFGVQLKGQVKSDDPARVTLRRSTLNYWRESDVPVVVIVWDEWTDRVFWEMSYLIDRYKKSPTAKSWKVTIGREWDDSSAALIKREISSRRALIRGHVQLPLSIVIERREDWMGDGRLTAELSARLRGLLIPRDEIHVGRVSTDVGIDIIIESKTILIRISGNPGIVLHFNNASPEKDRDRLLSTTLADVAAGLAVLTESLRLFALETYFLSAAVRDSDLILDEKALGGSLAKLAKPHSFAAMAELFRRSALHGTMLQRLQAMTVVMGELDKLGPNERKTLALLLRDEAPRDEIYSQALYNASQFVKGDDHDLARSLLNKASEVDPAYKDRSYFWSDLAGMDFHDGDYRESAAHYSKAVELGDDSFTAFYADALLYFGDLDESLAQFEKARDLNLEAHPEWNLKLLAFTDVRNRIGTPGPERHPEAAWKEAMELVVGDDLGVLRCLHLDYFCAPALMRLAISTADEQQRSRLMLASAFANPGDWNAWLMALQEIADHSPNLLGDAATCALQSAGPSIFEHAALSDFTSEQVTQALESVGRRPKPFTVRGVPTGSKSFEILSGPERT
ncbi:MULTISPECIES: DUF4365 domain-containing protein [unclassified Frondihabitans]|uniref:DUF4365 domain-containing protein n=1 Tax=unclassified Frondihabitans TaxID=2626248 RepID=UPI000F4E1AA9|nr:MULTISPECIES: DUF4365 domain-containing protein [unclassified Frondihabitans]RPE76469.1 uncharacterized protein DUF4365 [Frondihabitans sp. PhB153]RPF05255.1 uncharacterized protein DUF4365 [Frondihabitans sp. PhB161]